METKKQNFKFHEQVKKFNLDNIPIIGNFESQAIIGLDDDGIKFINNLEANNVDFDNLTEKEQILFNALKANGYFDVLTNKPTLETGYIHVTDNCNLHCVGCYSFKEHRNEKKNLPADKIKYIAKKLTDAGVSNIVFSGGEPFLRDDLCEILKYVKETLKSKDVSIISNGTMPLEKYLKCLPYIDKINISIDSYSADTHFIRDPGIMPKVLETINNLKNKIPIHIIATFNKKISPYLENFVQLSKDLGVTLSFSVLTVDYSNPLFKDYILTEEDYIKMYDFLRKNTNIVINDSTISDVNLVAYNHCGAGQNTVSIGADGTIYPCCMLHTDKLKMGNILTDDLTEVINSDKNPWKNISVDNFEKCKDCEYKYVCGGSCRAHSYYTYGDIFHEGHLCNQAKQQFKYIIDNIKQHYNID